MSGKDSQNRTATTGLPGQDCQGGAAKERTARTRQPGWGCKGEESQDKAARMGLERRGQPGQDSQDGAAKEMTAKSRHPEDNCLDRSAKAGLSDRTTRTGLLGQARTVRTKIAYCYVEDFFYWAPVS
jgi:hypothetical protein